MTYVLYEELCCGYSLELPHWGASNEYPEHNYVFMENWRKLSQNYHQILLLIKSSGYLLKPFKMQKGVNSFSLRQVPGKQIPELRIRRVLK